MRSGRRVVGAGCVWAGLLGAASGAAQSGAGPRYRVEPVTFALRVAEPVGARRSGSLCLPAGTIAWREARPEPGEADEAVVRGAREAGLDVQTADNPFEGTGRGVDRVIRARVRTLRLTACLPPGGLGRVFNHSQAIKGDGLIAVVWHVYARGQDAPVAAGGSCIAFSYKGDPATMSDLTLAGLRAAASRLAQGLKAGRPDAAAAEDAGCERLRGAGDRASSDRDD